MDKVKNKEWLENEFESAFDDNTAPTGGGYEADYTDKWGFYRKFEPCIIEYATQQSRIDAIRFLEWKTTNGWEYHINDVNEWLWYKEDKILTTDELYLLSINKK